MVGTQPVGIRFSMVGGNASAIRGSIAASGSRPSARRTHPDISGLPLGLVVAHAAVSGVRRRSNRRTNSGATGLSSDRTHSSGGGNLGVGSSTAVGPLAAARSPYVAPTWTRVSPSWSRRATAVEWPPSRRTSTSISAGPGSVRLGKWALTAIGSGRRTEARTADRTTETR